MVGLSQGRLKIWTEHSTLILLISKSFEVEPPKFQHFYNYKRNEFSPNLEGVAQKMGRLGPLEALDIFGRKSKFGGTQSLHIWCKAGTY